MSDTPDYELAFAKALVSFGAWALSPVWWVAKQLQTEKDKTR